MSKTKLRRTNLSPTDEFAELNSDERMTVLLAADELDETHPTAAALIRRLVECHLKDVVNPTEVLCVNGSIENVHGAGDGAYSIFDVAGSPAQMGLEVADCLRYADLFDGRGRSMRERNETVFVNLRFAVAAEGFERCCDCGDIINPEPDELHEC